VKWGRLRHGTGGHSLGGHGIGGHGVIRLHGVGTPDLGSPYAGGTAGLLSTNAQAADLPEDGRPALKKAVAMTEGYSAQCGHGEALQALGRALAEEGRTAEAAGALRRAVLAFHADGDKARLAGALTDWGVSLTGLGTLDNALTAHGTSLALMRELGDWRNEGIVLTNLGVTLSCAKRFEEAIEAFDLAATLLTIAGASAREAMALSGKGRALAKLGRYDEAVATLQAAAEAFRTAGDLAHEDELQAYLVITLRRAGRAPRSDVTITEPVPLRAIQSPSDVR
jgi:tetratricopeptide (TPR) repeat protein